MNIAQIGLGILARQGLNRRLPNRPALECEVAAWVIDRNAAHSGIDWRFTAADAHIRLKHLCPAIQLWRSSGALSGMHRRVGVRRYPSGRRGSGTTANAAASDPSAGASITGMACRFCNTSPRPLAPGDDVRYLATPSGE